MLARLGQLLNWVFTGLAVLLVLFGIIIFGFMKPLEPLLAGFMILGSALVSYAIGRACRYVLSGY